MRNLQMSRSQLIVGTIAAAALAMSWTVADATRERVSESASAPTSVNANARAPHDWDWLVGSWKVHHRRLKARLVGSTEWEAFDGTLVNWTTMGGAGNVGDNVMNRPGTTIRGVGIRAFDPTSGQWLVWWLDASKPEIAPPMRGGFENGIGTFNGEDIVNGKPIKVRVRWSRITHSSAHWEQASSPDGGATWEVNWTSDFTRVQ
jgi:hypothetical protein